MDDAEYIKYKAVLEHENLIPVRVGPNADVGATLQKMVACSYRLEQYSFFPQYRDAESFGRHMLDADNVPERVKPYVNLREFGQSHLIEANMSIGSYGVIRPEYEQKQTFAAEPEHEPEQDQQMGGM